MRKSIFLLLGAASLGLAATVDLNALLNYESQPVPAYIAKDNTSTNPISDRAATLGRVLFYDRELSVDRTVSCSSCHIQALGFSDPAPTSTGVAGQTGRHSMRLINARFTDETRFFWDERATTLEEQATMPIQDHAEMGFSGTLGDPDLDSLIRRLEAIDHYQELFDFAFGDPVITEDRMQRAIAQFVRSIQSFDSRFDDGLALTGNVAPPFPNFSPQENAGKQLFLAPAVFGPGGNRIGGGAGCQGCHRAPEFDIDPASGNNGVAGTAAGVGTDFTNTRSPSLRDVARPDGSLNGPFMHTGAFPTLGAVIAHYNNIPAAVAGIDPRLTPGGVPQNLNLTPAERAELEAFLLTLSGNNVYVDERWSDPFAGGGLDLVSLMCQVPTGLTTSSVTSTSVTVAWNQVPEALRYRVRGQTVPGGASAYRVLPSGLDTTLTVSGLKPGRTYLWTVQAACAPDDISDFASGETFTTPSTRLASLSLFPNPSTERVRVTGLPPEQALAVEVMGQSGQTIRVLNSYTGSDGTLDLSVSDLPSGTYRLNIRGAAQQWSEQVVVLRP